MSFFRAYIAPLLIVLTFLFAMVAVSARIFLPSDMLAPAPIEEPIGQLTVESTAAIASASGQIEVWSERSGIFS
ncbi:MAG: hypothetical protein F6K00_22915 [Leptolyngbya sp. SIOISBB]|nr:hypothetical protein [Leptolyngbya sp. SIOISBB]